MVTDVFLMTDVANLGSEGDVVKVADGYARNYLLPKKLGAPVTNETKRRLAKIQEKRRLEHQAELEVARKIEAKLTNISCTIPVKTDETGKLYGSVTSNDIADALKEQGFEIDKHSLLIEKIIKELGVFDIKIRLHPEVETDIKVWVVEE